MFVEQLARLAGGPPIPQAERATATRRSTACRAISLGLFAQQRPDPAEQGENQEWVGEKRQRRGGWRERLTEKDADGNDRKEDRRDKADNADRRGEMPGDAGHEQRQRPQGCA